MNVVISWHETLLRIVADLHFVTRNEDKGSYFVLVPKGRELTENNLGILLALLSVFYVAVTVVSFTMQLLPRLEDEQKFCAIYVDYFLPVP